jgi:hypothetical protein
VSAARKDSRPLTRFACLGQAGAQGTQGKVGSNHIFCGKSFDYMKKLSWKDVVLAITIFVNVVVWYLAYSRREIMERYWEITGISVVFLFWIVATRFEKAWIKVIALNTWIPKDEDDPSGGLPHDLYQLTKFFYIIIIAGFIISLITKLIG